MNSPTLSLAGVTLASGLVMVVRRGDAHLDRRLAPAALLIWAMACGFLLIAIWRWWTLPMGLTYAAGFVGLSRAWARTPGATDLAPTSTVENVRAADHPEE